MKNKSVFRCQSCGYESPKWLGQCPDCGEWNTLSEEAAPKAAVKAQSKALTGFSSAVARLSEASGQEEKKIPVGIAELDRLLGGGLVAGQILLLAGPPGIGKSTLMLQIAKHLASGRKILYVSGEESQGQVAARARRLDAASENIYILSETDLEKIIAARNSVSPDVLIVDSIQTVFHPALSGSPGTVGQVRECAAELLRLCKSSGTILFVLGHVTKEGSLAGPKVLEHIVDTVLYFDSEQQGLLRLLRAHKNRFGPTSELGIFQMESSGLAQVEDPAAFFTENGRDEAAVGRAFSVSMEGSRPLLAEIQALVSPTRYPYPRRVVTGMDLNRCQILFAAIERHLGISLESRDIFVSVAGGLSVRDTGTDLAVCAAVISSAKDIVIPPDWAFVGEVGILGHTYKVPWGGLRAAEAARRGFRKIFSHPLGASDRQPAATVVTVKSLKDLMAQLDQKSAKSATISH